MSLPADIAVEAAQPGSPKSAREAAFWRWWVPATSRDLWLGRIDRDTALRLLVNVARGTCPHLNWTPLEIDQSIDHELAGLDRRHLSAWCEIAKAVDPLFDGRRKPVEIQAVINRMAAERGFRDLDWDPLIRDRVAAWKWRQKRAS